MYWVLFLPFPYKINATALSMKITLTWLWSFNFSTLNVSRRRIQLNGATTSVRSNGNSHRLNQDLNKKKNKLDKSFLEKRNPLIVQLYNYLRLFAYGGFVCFFNNCLKKQPAWTFLNQLWRSLTQRWIILEMELLTLT